MQTQSDKLFSVFCHCSVKRTLSLVINIIIIITISIIIIIIIYFFSPSVVKIPRVKNTVKNGF